MYLTAPPIKQPKGWPILNKINKILADKKYCHEFQRTGACAKTGCRFMHIDPQKAYPSPITHNKKSNNKSVHRPKQNGRNKSPHKDRELSYSDNTKSKRTFKKPCFKFNNYGYCKFGDKCRYIHFEQSHNNQQHDQQMHTFLAEMRALVGSVKDMIESQKHVGPPVAFTGSATLPTCGSGTYGCSRFGAALGGHKKHKRIRKGKRGKN